MKVFIILSIAIFALPLKAQESSNDWQNQISPQLLELYQESDRGSEAVINAQAVNRNIFEKQISCLEGFTPSLLGPYELANNNANVIIPRKRGESKGFYVYTKQTAYFCDLPEKSTGENGAYPYQDIRIAMPGEPRESDIYLSSLKREFDVIIINRYPNERDKGKYARSNCMPYLTEKSKELLNSVITEKIAGISGFYDSLIQFINDDTLDKVLIYASQITKSNLEDEGPNALQKCQDIDGEIGDLAHQELFKLQSLIRQNQSSSTQSVEASN